MKELLKTTSLLLLLLVSGFTLSSCSDDDNEAGPLPELVGTWVCTDSYEAFYEDGQKLMSTPTRTKAAVSRLMPTVR